VTAKSPITTHVLDTSLGRPAAGVVVTLERLADRGAETLGTSVTNEDGRVTDLLAPGALTAGTYRITFEVGAYLERAGRSGFYPFVPVVFEIDSPTEHYHVPLLLNPYGYSTYRGS
jgi:5-hydroxyisourate hydrolase